MSHGLKIYKNNGAITFSTDEVTWNQVGVLLCPANGSASETFPVLAGKEVLTVQIPINPPSLSSRTYAHTITISGTSISASGGNTAAFILVLMR